MTQRSRACKALDRVGVINHVLAFDQRHLFGDVTGPGLGFQTQLERGDASLAFCFKVLPLAPCDLAMRWMLLAIEFFGVAAEGHAKPVATQGHEHRDVEFQALVLPRADVIRLHRLCRVAIERDGRHLRAGFGDGQLDLGGTHHP